MSLSQNSNDLLPVSVVIPVRNEEHNLPACLAKLSRFSEILVVDSQSDDRTVEIAEAAGARVIQFHWTGTFPKKRNHVLMNEELANDWILFLDADEHVSEAFCDALAAELPQSDKVGYWLTYSNYFMGKLMRHGVAQRKLALIRKGAGLYEKIDEDGWSQLDMEIHEHPILDGEIGEIEGEIDHRDFAGLEKFLRRHIDYAKWEAARSAKLKAGGDAALNDLTSRQRFKYRHLEKWWFPWFYFCFAYFAKRGFLDGGAGLSYAFYKAWYFHSIRLLIKENAAAK
ncbi:Glycosyl transferase family 2 [Pelagimonas phthalicica]|uniref:Glycosyl transferase family 2 n=1 Tax=Pelagimonas phthalicica TaxID=1037362 RepID=A0A238JGQ8_9RHOB|nr:glycosyltransferase family 2 protein [Pelagimonas phthalicica]TDS89243.1 glycosyltransferase involved in cell wall biosynthesis [Pelagimonas phthalicica]SMX29583.1 Glycosyl transferase family 2 [Pelagimonas phthalicica]